MTSAISLFVLLSLLCSIYAQYLPRRVIQTDIHDHGHDHGSPVSRRRGTSGLSNLRSRHELESILGRPHDPLSHLLNGRSSQLIDPFRPDIRSPLSRRRTIPVDHHDHGHTDIHDSTGIRDTLRRQRNRGISRIGSSDIHRHSDTRDSLDSLRRLRNRGRIGGDFSDRDLIDSLSRGRRINDLGDNIWRGRGRERGRERDQRRRIINRRINRNRQIRTLPPQRRRRQGFVSSALNSLFSLIGGR